MTTFVAVQVTARHQVGSRPPSTSRKDDAVDQMRQLVFLDGPKSLNVSWMKTRVPRHDDVPANDGVWLSAWVLRDFDMALAFPQHVPCVADAKQQPRSWDKDTAFLILFVLHSLLKLGTDEFGNLGTDLIERLEDQLIREVILANICKEAKGGRGVALGTGEKLKVIVLLS